MAFALVAVESFLFLLSLPVVIELALFLFVPFVAQWSIGNFITASGTSLCGLLAPIGAVLFCGPRESIAWFIAYIFLTALSGFFDYYLAGAPVSNTHKVSTETSVVFFALNFAAISSIVYLLLLFIGFFFCLAFSFCGFFSLCFLKSGSLAVCSLFLLWLFGCRKFLVKLNVDYRKRCKRNVD